MARPARRREIGDVQRRAQAHGISEYALERAKAQIHVVSEQRGEDHKNVWYWRLPNVEETAEILTELWKEPGPGEGMANDEI